MEKYLNKKEIKNIIRTYYKEEENTNVKVRISVKLDDALSQFFGKIVLNPYITIENDSKKEEIDKTRFTNIITTQFDKYGCKVDSIRFNTEVTDLLEIPKFKGITVSYTKALNKPMTKTLKKNS